jgi:hypothetical protein
MEKQCFSPFSSSFNEEQESRNYDEIKKSLGVLSHNVCLGALTPFDYMKKYQHMIKNLEDQKKKTANFCESLKERNLNDLHQTWGFNSFS